MPSQKFFDGVPLIAAGKTQPIVIDPVSGMLFTVGKKPTDEAKNYLRIGSIKFPLRGEEIAKQEIRFFEQEKPELEALLSETSDLKKITKIKAAVEKDSLLTFILDYVLPCDESRKLSGQVLQEFNSVSVAAAMSVLLFSSGSMPALLAIGAALSPHILKELQKEAGVQLENKKKPKLSYFGSRIILDAINTSDINIDGLLDLNKEDLVKTLCAVDENRFPLIPRVLDTPVFIFGGLSERPKIWILKEYSGNADNVPVHINTRGKNFSISALEYADQIFNNYVSVISDEIKLRREIITKVANKLKTQSIDSNLEKIIKNKSKTPTNFKQVGFFFDGDKATVYVNVPPTIIITADGYYLPLPQRTVIERKKYEVVLDPPHDLRMGVDLQMKHGIVTLGWPRILPPHTVDKYKFCGQYSHDSSLCAPQLHDRPYTKTYRPEDVVQFLFDARSTILIGWATAASNYGYDTPPYMFEVIDKEKAESLVASGKYKLFPHKVTQRYHGA